MRDTEHVSQVQVMMWAKVHEGQYPMLRYLHAIPNGGYRHISTARKLKAEGVKPGVPDLCLPFPVGKYHGLYIEMKAEGGALSEEQRVWLDYLCKVGYRAVACFSFDEAVSQIEYYLEGKRVGDV